MPKQMMTIMDTKNNFNSCYKLNSYSNKFKHTFQCVAMFCFKLFSTYELNVSFYVKTYKLYITYILTIT